MAGFNRKDWEELNISKEEVENLTEALKKDEFRKLLAEYADEISDPKNRKQYQEDIIQLEAERGVDCTFVNPEPGFVIKTSVDGKKKAFINICQNNVIGRPSLKPVIKDNVKGLSWSIPYSQAPGREDMDNKNNRCTVYDVVFHPETLHLSEKNLQFKKLVIDTALNAVEDSYNVKLDKKNIKLPKLKFKGMPFAAVIRKKSKTQPVLSEEDAEFHKNIKYPYAPPPADDIKPTVKNFDNKEDKEKYTIPKYTIKHRTDIDLQEFTYDKNAKINAAIPKELVIEVNLPLLNSTNEVTLDVMEKSLHLICEKPAKYKLDIQLPYSVNEESGNAKFDKDRRLLIITLPVIKARISAVDLLREDSGVESDFGERNNSCDDASPVGSVDMESEVFIECEKSEEEPSDDALRTNHTFLDTDKHYFLPPYICNVDGNNMCFVLNVKNVDSNSVVQTMPDSNSLHVKFGSVGSGFFPIHHAFLVKFEDGHIKEESVIVDTWDNNVTVQLELELNDATVKKYFVGIDEDSLTEKTFEQPIDLVKVMNEMKEEAEKELNEGKEGKIEVLSANVDEVVVNIKPDEENLEDEEENNDDNSGKDSKDSDDSEVSIQEDLGKKPKPPKMTCRTLSESHADEVVISNLVARKSILKNRICRSLSESHTDDFVFSSMEGLMSMGSDTCIQEDTGENKESKKTVRFNDKIRRQIFRANSSILGQRQKNQKRNMKKRRALERRASESENSECEEKERDKRTKKNNKNKNKKKGPLIQVISNEKKKKDDCDGTEAVNEKEKENNGESIEKTRSGLKKDDKIFEFVSDLIFDLDI